MNNHQDTITKAFRSAGIYASDDEVSRIAEACAYSGYSPQDVRETVAAAQRRSKPACEPKEAFGS